MKTLFIWLLSNFLLITAYGMPPAKDNKKIAGRILEKGSEAPIEFANIGLYRSMDNSLVAGTISDEKGGFSFSSLPEGNYYIEYSFIGYQKQQSAVFAVNSNDRVNLGNFYLQPEVMYLNEVVVQGKRPIYVSKTDKKVFNVSEDLMSTFGSVSDLLQNIPSVQVDAAGNVSLRGSDKVNILINGKSSAMMNSRSRTDVLSQLSASNIERIEVITNPSAQYKPDGVSGIINIVMKKSNETGVNGSVLANVGTQERVNAGTSLSYNTGRVNLFANYGMRRDYRDFSSIDNRNMNDLSVISQRNTGGAHPFSHNIQAGTEWAINPKNRLQVSGNYNHKYFTRNDFIATTREKDGLSSLSSNRRYGDEKSNQVEASSIYSHTFGKDHELTASYNYSLWKNRERNNYSDIQNADNINAQLYDINMAQHLLGVTYTKQLNKLWKLNMGYELDVLRTRLNQHVWNILDGVTTPDINSTNDFTNTQNNHAIYTTLEYKSKKWGIQLGVRPEMTWTRSELFSLDSVVNNNYFMVYPTLHTSYKINGHNELQLSYSLRVNRPEADNLNPFPEYQDSITLHAGNPYLKPEKIHSVELGYQWQQGATTILGTLYYRYITHKMTMIAQQLPNSAIQTTMANLNSGSSAGAELIFNTKLGNWSTINLSGNLFYDQIDARTLGFEKVRDNIAWSASLNVSFNLFRGASLQVNSRYLSPSLLPQGRREGAFVTNMSMKYDIPRINLSLVATLSDVFDSFKEVYTIETPEFKQYFKERTDIRNFYIGAVWKFGASVQKKK